MKNRIRPILSTVVLSVSRREARKSVSRMRFSVRGLFDRNKRCFFSASSPFRLSAWTISGRSRSSIDLRKESRGSSMSASSLGVPEAAAGVICDPTPNLATTKSILLARIFQRTGAAIWNDFISTKLSSLDHRIGGGNLMPTSQEYRQRADECLEIANEA